MIHSGGLIDSYISQYIRTVSEVNKKLCASQLAKEIHGLILVMIFFLRIVILDRSSWAVDLIIKFYYKKLRVIKSMML